MYWHVSLFLWITYIYGSLETSFSVASVQKIMQFVESHEVEWRVAISDDWDVSDFAFSLPPCTYLTVLSQ